MSTGWANDVFLGQSSTKSALDETKAIGANVRLLP